MPGISFKDVRTGIRAQIQHLKAYASAEDLCQDCVDPRYKYVKKGCAPTFESLAGRLLYRQGVIPKISVVAFCVLHNLSGID